LGVRLTTPPRKKILLRNLKRRPRPTQGCRDDDDDDDDINNDAVLFWNMFLNDIQIVPNGLSSSMRRNSERYADETAAGALVIRVTTII
jgi:hypothetical protein